MRNLNRLKGCIYCFLVLFIIFGCSQKNKIDWSINLNQNNKDPYGLYIAHNEVGNLAQGKVKELEKLSDIDIAPNEAKNYAVVFITSEVFLDDHTKDNLDKLVKNGGIVMISDYQDNTNDTIYTDTFVINQPFELQKDEKYKISAKKEVEHHYFKTFDDTFETIGWLNYNGKSYPNYLKKQPKNSKGYFLFHAEPLYFTNYYLLNQDSYFYSKSVLKELKGRTILWYNSNKTYASADTSVMRYIMSQPALKSAWILLLILLFIYLIFRSRREQRIIPLIEKEENHTVEFAKTISSLYQENGEIKDIITKKIEFFLYRIRKNFMIETDDLSNKNFIEIVAQKANYTQEECIQLFNTIIEIQHKNQPTQQDLKVVHQIIENYKQKANI